MCSALFDGKLSEGLQTYPLVRREVGDNREARASDMAKQYAKRFEDEKRQP